MNRCLSCEKPISGSTRYHPACLGRLFEGGACPRLSLALADFPAEVQKVAGRMSAISGVQPKAFVRVDEDGTLALASRGGTHILKPAQTHWPELPQNENTCMTLAEDFGMETAPHALLQMSDGAWAHVTRRFDRREGQKVHKEDMAQVLGESVAEKNDGSLEKVGRAILRHSAYGGLDAVAFFERALLCFLLGNGDMHLKNWSLLETDAKTIRLAPCYDWVSTALYLPEGEESALSLNGKRNRIGRMDFDRLADNLGIDPKARENAFDRIFRRKRELLMGVQNSFLSEPSKEALAKLLETRRTRLDQKTLSF